VPANDFGGAGAVAGQARDLLYWHARVGHETDEGMPQLTGRSSAGYLGRHDGSPELASDVGGVELAAVAGCEYESFLRAFSVAKVS